MEPAADPGSSSGSYDKSKVLDVKPLRCLAPIFPPPPSPSGSQSSSSAFVCAPPFGPFPSGYSPFYPIYNTSDSQSTPLQATAPPPPPPPPNRRPPLFDADTGGPPNKNYKIQDDLNHDDSIKSVSEDDGWSNNQTPPGNHLRTMNVPSNVVEGTIGNGEKKSKSHKRTRCGDEIRFFSPADGDSESVGEIRMKFDALRRRLSQIEDAREGSSGNKRPDLKAGTLMMNKGLRTNTRKRTGTVPGIEIGDVFFFRIEMCLVGLHAPSMAGIDYMNLRFDHEEETVAVSIVSAGVYEDDVEDSNVLIYSGQGGIVKKKEGKEVSDQKLERGNLALERSLRRGNEVRVIRGMKDVNGNPSGKVYIYDGLYKIQESWTEKGKSGCNVFKYKLLRIPGQPEAFSIWKSIQQWRDIITGRPGLILPDLTSGAEKIPVSLVNDIDDEKGPAHFTYSPSLKYSRSIDSMKAFVGCECRGVCLPGDPNCSCVTRNGGDLPHTANGILVTRKHLIHECGPYCLCYPNCRNHISQSGLRVRLEVFRTSDRGWGLRSWDPIRAGTFICEYAGQVIDKIKDAKDREDDEEDEYVFDPSYTADNSSEWNYIPELLGEERRGDSYEACKRPLSLVITAKHIGNVARFMNHSCSANVFWQPVLYDHNDESLPHIMFYALKHIPPMTELTYDYGLGGSDNSKEHRRKKCLCGSFKCRGYFG